MTDRTEETFGYKQLDPLLHSPIRLAIISLLYSCEEADFTYIKNKIGATDGNLNNHLAKLEKQGWIEVKKSFVNKKPVTSQSITEAGRKAFLDYVQRLEQFINPAIKGDSSS